MLSLVRLAMNWLKYVEIGASEGNVVEALLHWFPGLATKHHGTQMPVPVSPHGYRCDQQLGTRTRGRISKELLACLRLGLVNQLLEVRERHKWIIKILMVVNELLQNGTKDWMLDQHTWDLPTGSWDRMKGFRMASRIAT